MTKKIILTAGAPAPVGPYNQAVLSGNTLYCAGQIPLTKNGQKVAGGVAEQTEQVFANIKAVLTEAGATLDHVVKTTVFLTSMDDFPEMNKVYARHFKEGLAPARSTVAVAALPLGVAVEIEVIATL
ncbi:MAG: Rid family detoxifying hydrolase [Candidatus Omnitrophica bacterium]|nr:Rid family detoxifying hydrolase [Candidatus Omnitrophota bacterium]